MEASIVTPTWNNANRLRVTLDAMAAMRVSNDVRWEVLVVNNNCTDSTNQVVAGFQHRLPLRIVHEPRQGLNRARNAGTVAARGELVVFGEDDVTVAPGWLQAYVQTFRRYPEGYFFGGRIVSDYEGAPPRKELMPFAPVSVKGLELGPEERVLDRPAFIGPNWACRRHDLLRLGGFDPELDLNPARRHVMIGGEREMMRRLIADGVMPRYLPDACVEHFVAESKCRLRHLADRAEASSYYLQCRELQLAGIVFPVPRRRWWPKYVRQWLRWQLHFLWRRDREVEYIRLRQLKGARRAFVDAIRKAADQHCALEPTRHGNELAWMGTDEAASETD